ncbi:MAG: TonB-dependent receptor [Taibaiella sp.]
MIFRIYKNILYLPLLIVLHVNASAQIQQTLSGKVTDIKGAVIDYAILELHTLADSSIIKTEVTDSSGKYSITLPSVVHSYLKVTALGFASQTKVIHDTTSTQIDFALNEASHEIGEVTISAQKPLIERKIDRTIFNVSQSISAIGGDGLDAIKKAPGVNISNGNIALVGKNTVNILVNDKLIQLSGDDLINYLRSLSADNISRIEVITTPPAQYEAAGNSGLINIVLKKNKSDGINGLLRAGYQQASLGMIIAGGSINYHQGKVSLNGGINCNYGATKPVENSIAYFPMQTFESTDKRKDNKNILQSNFGIDYELHKGGLLGFRYIASLVRPDITEQNKVLVKDRYGALDSTLTTNAGSKRKQLSNNINFNYAWDIDTSGKKLSANINRMWYSSDQNRHFVSQNYIDENISTGPKNDNKTTGDQAVNITTAQLDITHPTSLIALSYGGKLSFINNNSTNTFWALDGNEYKGDTSLSNQFNYWEKVQALYFSASKEVGKWSFQAGLRAEFTQTKGQSVRYNQTNTNNYFQLFPTAYIQYNINSNNVINVNYSKRIQRPGYSSLDPFRWFVTPYQYAEGNPFLKPSFNHNFELSYTYKQRYSLTVYYQKTVQSFGQLSILDTLNNIQHYKRDNLGSASSYGLTGSTTLNPAPWWESQIEASGYYSRLESMYYDGIKKEYGKPSFFVQSNNSFILNKSKTFLAELSFDYSSPSQSEYDEVRPNGSVNAGFKLLLLDKKLTLSLSTNDILATSRYRAQNVYNKTTIDNYYDDRSLRLMLNYKLGNKRQKEVRKRDTGIEAEAGRTN